MEKVKNLYVKQLIHLLNEDENLVNANIRFIVCLHCLFFLHLFVYTFEYFAFAVIHLSFDIIFRNYHSP
jgi:hypothetical protein